MDQHWGWSGRGTGGTFLLLPPSGRHKQYHKDVTLLAKEFLALCTDSLRAPPSKVFPRGRWSKLRSQKHGLICTGSAGMAFAAGLRSGKCFLAALRRAGLPVILRFGFIRRLVALFVCLVSSPAPPGGQGPSSSHSQLHPYLLKREPAHSRCSANRHSTVIHWASTLCMVLVWDTSVNKADS